MREILFCGNFMPPEINEKSKYTTAVNNFQKGLIDNLSKHYKVDILTYIGYYEKDINSVIESFKNNNIYYTIKQESKNYISLFSKYYKLFNKLIQNKQAVILYDYCYINLFVNYYCKKKNIKTILIISDPVEHYEYHNPIRRFLAYKYSRDYYKFNYLIFLSKRLKDRYDLENSFLMVGGIDNTKYKNFIPTFKNDKLIILYSGNLSKITGIDIYLKAIELINEKNIKFLFSGKGDMEDFLKKISKKDSRIEYVGFLEEKEYLLLLNKANVLINPRNMNLPRNQNNFPSKILEYLATGKVIISTKFSNYRDFEENIFFCETDPLSIANKIKFVTKNYDKKYKEIFNKNRKKASRYDWYLQAEKIKLLIEA